MAGDGSHALLVLGFESTDHPVEEAMARALEICAEHGGDVPSERAAAGGGGDAVGSWREAFLGAPYLRDALVAMGVLARRSRRRSRGSASPRFHERVTAAARGGRARGRAARARRVLPLHARLPRRPGALLHGARAGAPRRGGRAVGAIKRGGVATRSSPRAARSPTTTPSGATIGPGMTASARSRSRAALRGGQGGGRSRAAIMNPGVLLDASPTCAMKRSRCSAPAASAGCWRARSTRAGAAT